MSNELSRLNWFKSSYSGGQTSCVEVAWVEGGVVGVRDSKNPTGPALVFSPSAWDAFTAGVVGGDFKQQA
ncbi:DUF397 domain-containing protein [Nocardia australiensis]|uniref:DUF397 domain-containing protein n=1 Tax=Nocardia australiensis TaxID=2887191 RepID=UPI001D135B1E|nr:DUF397 domain-containing protein [Nocardia australiensis]